MFVTFESMVRSLEAHTDLENYLSQELDLMKLPSVDYCWRQYPTEVFRLPAYIKFVNLGFWVTNRIIVPKVFELVEAVKGKSGVTEWAAVRLYERAVISIPDTKALTLDLEALFDDL